MAFFNRVDELAALDERLKSSRAEYFVLYADQLEDVSAEVATFTGSRVLAEQPLTGWRAVFAAFSELLAAGQTMIVLDEFQFIARQEPEIGSLLNRFVAEHAANPDLLLCLAGSDVSFFERDLVGYGATTYGRRTGSLRLQPFPWVEVAPFVDGWSIEDRIRSWAVFGGVPYYLEEIDPGADLAEAIRRAVLYPDGLLREEPRFLLAQESRLRDTDTYMSCLRAIAGGTTRLNEIAQRIGKARSEEARPFLETLEEMGLVERRYPEEGTLRSRSYEADAVVVDEGGAVQALGSCKWADRETPSHAHSAAELDKLETIRAELNAPEAHLYFFDRVAFSPRLRELAAERDDVHLVLAEQLV